MKKDPDHFAIDWKKSGSLKTQGNRPASVNLPSPDMSCNRAPGLLSLFPVWPLA